MQRVARRLNRWSENVCREKELPSSITPQHIAQFAVCQIIAYELTIPSSSIDRPRDYFIQNHVSIAEHLIAKINEYLVMDLRNALDLVQKIWMTRYTMIHTPFSNEAVRAMQSVLSDDHNFRIAPKYQYVVQHIDASMIYEIYNEVQQDVRGPVEEVQKSRESHVT